MLLFDAPNREVCTAQRSRSNTPLQALALMNDTQYVEAARALAARLLREVPEGPESIDARIDRATLLVAGREARPAERAALVDRCRRANMAIYASERTGEDKALPRGLGRALGLERLDANYLSDDDGITAIRVEPGKREAGYIPYTDRPIRWHTDGYYNEPGRQ
ncbi:MAG TPA: DUF1553 domain-containing protein, partial [Usitatibacteraceae bacterium]|nr:DUF1553 domain-containing protein [Usitatibacteraceae bacterium]